jgi:hypothetical protein
VNFTQILFLFGSVAVIGPLLAHLFARPKYKRIAFTMLRFLKVGEFESQSKRRLRDLLILLLRCLIVFLIAVLFARPGILSSNKNEQIHPVHYLALDNSISMSYSDGDKKYFDAMIDAASDYIDSADPESQFNIYSLASGLWSKGITRQAALSELSQLKIAAVEPDISAFFQEIKADMLQNNVYTNVFIVSDFTPAFLKKFSNMSGQFPASGLNYNLIKSDKPINNAAIVSASIGSLVDRILTINVAVKNYGDIKQQRSLVAKIDNHEKEPLNVELLPYKLQVYQVTVKLETTTSQQSFLPVELNLKGKDGLKDDDTYYFALSIPAYKNIKVGILHDDLPKAFLLETAIKTLTEIESFEKIIFERIPYSQLDETRLSSFDNLIVPDLDVGTNLKVSVLEDFINQGGKIVFFMSSGKIDEKLAEELWQRGILPAKPKRLISESAKIESYYPINSSSLSFESSFADERLMNYPMDKVTLNGYYELEVDSKGVCLWQLSNGCGFVYVKQLKNGKTVLVNTSADDSLGNLTKSNIAVAFCWFLFGHDSSITKNNFACGERISIPVDKTDSALFESKQLWVQMPDNEQVKAAFSMPFLSVKPSLSPGWVKTLSNPKRFAGINLPPEETDMTKPDQTVIENAAVKIENMNDPQSKALSTDGLKKIEYKPLWKIIAVLIIILLFVESSVTNRLKR